MDAVQRAYAHTAWTPLDPLKGLNNEVKRALLLMPTTFRERFKLAPWTTRDQRRTAMVQILAERRLMLELATEPASQQPEMTVLAPSSAPGILPAETPLNAFYRHRLEAMADTRLRQDSYDTATTPAGADDAARRESLRTRYRAIQMERTRLDREESDLFGQAEPSLAAASIPPQRVTRRSRGR
jgi:hypothetical protein